MARSILVWAVALSATLPRTASGLDATAGSIFEAILLPGLAQEARRAGMPDADIEAVFNVSREQNLPAEERRVLLETTTEAVRENGPIDNFGAFVQDRLAQGLRGRDLADAIRAEHQMRGKGKGQGQGRQDHGADAPDARGGKPDDRGKPDNPGTDQRAGAKGRGEQGKNNENKGGGV